MSMPTKSNIIGVREWREPNTKVVNIRSSQGVDTCKPCKIQMLVMSEPTPQDLEEITHVGEDHQIANCVTWVQSTGGIGYEQMAHSK